MDYAISFHAPIATSSPTSRFQPQSLSVSFVCPTFNHIHNLIPPSFKSWHPIDNFINIFIYITNLSSLMLKLIPLSISWIYNIINEMSSSIYASLNLINLYHCQHHSSMFLLMLSTNASIDDSINDLYQNLWRCFYKHRMTMSFVVILIQLHSNSSTMHRQVTKVCICAIFKKKISSSQYQLCI